MTTLIVTSPACLEHDQGEGHPESPLRLQKVLAGLHHAYDDNPNVRWAESDRVEIDLLKQVHDPVYIDRLFAIDAQLHGTNEIVSLDDDTKASAGTLKAALYGAGAVVKAIDDICFGKADNAFCAIRPPGHHALKNASMGFCVFGNVALGAFHALNKGYASRVAIIDYDVHKGNGTQDLIKDEPRIKLFSTQQADIWPYEGVDHDTSDNVRNFYIPAQMPTDEYRDLYTNHILPELDAFKPDLIIISCGFDAHADDPPADILFNDQPGRQLLREDDFNWVTQQLITIANKHAQGRLVSVLEGGYNVDVLERCCKEHVRVLAN